ncbi:hypothetical protein Ahy_B03g066285 isoform A [Arachis hypogaea]|uniref:Cationic amino acid transporter C-terminal domain-containing protein n=1 Tax=Arachis hypogaea TaxID=3818 RepID=A0A445A3N0_ARAHY|nr:hypothetical protein Ahy_B03g066285 isoform A [Arachis hypogaea]
MRRCLTAWDLTWLAFGSVVGSGIFVITGQEARTDAGPAIVLSYAISGFSALLSALCYTEFAVDVPVAGAVVGAAGLGRSWSSYFASMIKNDPDFFRMTTSLLVGSMGQARYMTQIARSHMIPPFFALIHPKTGTPVNATLFITLLSSIVGLFSSLDVLSNVFSISTLFIFMLMAVALLVRRYYVRQNTSKEDLMRVLGCLFVIIASSAVGTALWNANKLGWIGYTVAAVVWLIGTLAMSFLPKQRTPKVWGVPLVPWLPSLSIATNLFLIGSLEPDAFWRFFLCTAFMLLYYIFVGVHATYDVEHQNSHYFKDVEPTDQPNHGPFVT